MMAQDLLTEMGCPNPQELIIERFTLLIKREPYYIVYRDPNLNHELTESALYIPDQEIYKMTRIYGPKKEGSLI